MGARTWTAWSSIPLPPSVGTPVNQVYVRYSAVIYNRWDFDPATGKYLRFADTADDFNNKNPQYKQLTDRLTSQPIAFDNLVVLYANHELYSPGIYDIQLIGSGDGYAFRDGQAYPVKWQRGAAGVVSLLTPDGLPYAFKPGDHLVRGAWGRLRTSRRTPKSGGSLTTCRKIMKGDQMVALLT